MAWGRRRRRWGRGSSQPSRTSGSWAWKFQGSDLKYHKPKEPVNCRVRCSNALHTITILPSGALVLRHHDSVANEELLMSMGMPEPRCLTILKEWRAGDSAYSHKVLPKELRIPHGSKHAETKDRLCIQRANKPTLSSFQTLKEGNYLRNDSVVYRAIKRRFMECLQALLPKDEWERVSEEDSELRIRIWDKVDWNQFCGYPPRIHVAWDWSHNDHTKVYVGGYLPLQWYTRVWKAGKALKNPDWGILLAEVPAEGVEGPMEIYLKPEWIDGKIQWGRWRPAKLYV